MTITKHSTDFGGSGINGDAASDTIYHCVLPIPGSPQSHIITSIIAGYGFNAHFQAGGDLDYEDPALGYRSFTGRLLVVENAIDHDLPLNGTPDLLLTSKPSVIDSTLGRVVFDRLIHDFKQQNQFHFDINSAYGRLITPDVGLTVILVAGVIYNGAGVAQPVLSQLLHVMGRVTGDTSEFSLGEFKARN